MDRVPAITIHSFCQSPDTIRTVERAVADRRLSRTQAKLHCGGIADAINAYGEQVSPSVIIFESWEDLTSLLPQLNILADRCISATKVIAIGHTNDVTVYRELLLQGVSDYLVAPFEPIVLVASLARLYQQPGGAKSGRVLAFIGATGGAGSSTIARNVAWIMGRSYGCNVILLDLDVAFGTAGLGCDLNPAHGITEALKDGNRFDEVLLERLLTKYDDHLQVLTAPASLAQCYDFEQSAFDKLLETAQSSAPFLILDVPHLWSSWTKRILTAAEEVVITAQPDLSGLRNTKSLLDTLAEARPNDALPKVVLNQIGVSKRSEIRPSQFEGALQCPPVVWIPFDGSTVSTAANNGQMIADISTTSPVYTNLTKLATLISGRGPKNEKKAFTLAPIWNACERLLPPNARILVKHGIAR